mgnify:CR=1 FL=1
MEKTTVSNGLSVWIKQHCPGKGIGAYKTACETLGCPVLTFCKTLTCRKRAEPVAKPRPCGCRSKPS